MLFGFEQTDDYPSAKAQTVLPSLRFRIPTIAFMLPWRQVTVERLRGCENIEVLAKELGYRGDKCPGSVGNGEGVLPVR
jgi:hypothetical protein